jgi:hypothetical protein
MIPTPKFFFQNSSMNSITHNQKKVKIEKKIHMALLQSFNVLKGKLRKKIKYEKQNE